MRFLILAFLLFNVLVADKTYKVVVNKDFPPEYILTDRNIPSGFAIELFEEVAKEADIKFEYAIKNNWQEILNDFAHNKADIVPIIRISPQDKKYLITTKPAVLFEVSVFKRASFHALRTLEDLKNYKVIVRNNSVGQRLLNTHPKELLMVVNSVEEGIFKLLSGESDAFVFPKAYVEYYLKKVGLSEKIVALNTPILELKRGIGVHKSHPELAEKLNIALEKVLHSQEYQNLYKKWYQDQKEVVWKTKEMAVLVVLVVLLTLGATYIWRYFSLRRIQKESEKLVRMEKERFELAIKGSNSGIFDWNIEKKEIYFSHKWKELIGYKDQEIRNELRQWWKRVHPDDLKNVKEALKTYLKRNSSRFDITFRMIHKQGHVVWIHAKAELSFNENNEPSRMVGFHTDMTELIEYRDLLEKKVNEQIELLRKQDTKILEHSRMASLGTMIGNIAHQWRQPLNTISVASSSLGLLHEMGNPSKEEVKRLVDGIIKNTNYLSTTIDTFRGFIKQNRVYENICIESEIEEAINISSASIKNNFIDLQYTKNQIKECNIFGIQGEFTQVIINILNNSKDALLMDQIKNPQITLRAEQQDDHVLISICDNAGGISQEALPHIFEPYFTTKHQYQGTGLGLHICYEIITKSFHGNIYAKNNDEGACIFIEIPITSSK